MRSRVATPRALVVLALVVGASVVVVLLTRGPDSRLAAAVELAPEGTARMSWTDWTAVRREVGTDVSADSTAEEVRAFLDEAFEHDLSATTALGSSAPVMQAEYGVSPATLDWELFAQSEEGAVVVMGLGDLDPEGLGDRLEGLGYQRPGESDGIWEGGVDLLPRIGEGLTPELQYAAILADQGLLLTSDQPGFLETALAAAGGEGATADGLDEVVGHSGDAVAGLVYSGAHACEKLAMGQADPDDQAEAEALLSEAGEVHPMTAMAMSRQPGGGVRVVMSFADEETAREDAETRARLAAGPAPGQGGDFSERFAVESAVADGPAVVLDLAPREGQYVLSDVSSGPVLFATC
ncbi:hypothetical protein DDE18_02185 [Nocardioides gansuensis]|uniref:DUF3352 domain-containing protein n=1 Tax=Nocardioides gansuensis TaxID=2138300 RepID=A0A2T8FFF6_9ACTN|nr:hypothetical protein [Nocardioides gansuensis]PVG84443.1 hypothetical protein DDE18_02185 [Nocardioides gansuensis]